MGSEATALDYVAKRVSEGASWRELSAEAEEAGAPALSPGFLSFVASRLAPSAKERIQHARATGCDVPLPDPMRNGELHLAALLNRPPVRQVEVTA
jgi:hypothetical protein